MISSRRHVPRPTNVTFTFIPDIEDARVLAYQDRREVGSIKATSYVINGRWHVRKLNSMEEGQGIGTWLVNELWEKLGCKELTVIPASKIDKFWPHYDQRYPGRVKILASDENPDGFNLAN